MHITILYATYSNSTYTAAEVLSEELKQLGHAVTVELVHTATSQTLTDAELTIFASPSWDYDGKEGQPHEDFFGFFSRVSASGVSPIVFSYAIMALGDSNYTYFCGAAEELVTLATAVGGKQVSKALKIDQYYLNETTCVQAIKTWAQQLVTPTTT
ncbi:MAG: hypothetical protein A2632_00455 [Candidatus Pacebacteria bacterium RIFCSPHIGHO2_01_FULL_46_16]|nr:MAG: hypothetical protein A2632_00455 [Candidatus Pacebacteria bacterium RIFCSPHIGHO2_01_FULL_46_16]OGJ38731.1 MAG: hypothetical protein A3A82_03310 [Candidatus Pacebacteria bacterium RIFCSPLOWO2_01_FULL_47_12]